MTTATAPVHLTLLRTTYQVSIPIRFARSNDLASLLVQRIEKALPAQDAVVFADYGTTALTFTVRNYRGKPLSEIAMGKAIAEIMEGLAKV